MKSSVPASLGGPHRRLCTHRWHHGGLIPDSDIYYLDLLKVSDVRVYIVSDLHLPYPPPDPNGQYSHDARFNDDARSERAVRQRARIETILDQIEAECNSPSEERNFVLVLLGDIYDWARQRHDIGSDMVSMREVMRQHSWLGERLQNLKTQVEDTTDETEFLIVYVRGNHDEILQPGDLIDECPHIEYGGDQLLLLKGKGQNVLLEHGQRYEIFESRRFYSDAQLMGHGFAPGYYYSRVAVSSMKQRTERFSGCEHKLTSLVRSLYADTCACHRAIFRKLSESVANCSQLADSSRNSNALPIDIEITLPPSEMMGVSTSKNLEDEGEGESEEEGDAGSGVESISFAKLFYGENPIMPRDLGYRLQIDPSYVELEDVTIVGKDDQTQDGEGSPGVLGRLPVSEIVLRQAALKYALVRNSCLCPLFGSWKLPPSLLDELVVCMLPGGFSDMQYVPARFGPFFTFVVMAHVHQLALSTHSTSVNGLPLVFVNSGHAREWTSCSDYVRITLSSSVSRISAFQIHDGDAVDLGRESVYEQEVQVDEMVQKQWFHGDTLRRRRGGDVAFSAFRLTNDFERELHTPLCRSASLRSCESPSPNLKVRRQRATFFPLNDRQCSGWYRCPGHAWTAETAEELLEDVSSCARSPGERIDVGDTPFVWEPSGVPHVGRETFQ